MGNSRKKILLVTRPICPPWDEASKNFAFALSQNIADFDFCLLTGGLIPNLPINILQMPIYTSGHLNFFQKIKLLKLRKLLRDNNFDIIHFMLTPTKFNVFSFQTFINTKNAKIIQTVATLREDLFSDAEIKKLMFGDFIVTYSQYAKNKLKTLGFENVEQVYPGIDLNLYSPAPKNMSLMQQLGIVLDDFVVVYPGEYTRLGNINKLIEGMLKYSSALKEKKIKIILAFRVKNKKDFLKKEEIGNILKKSGMESFILADSFTNMDKVYNLADVVIFPVENMKGKFDIPLGVVEPMACAKPVIISDLPILQEFANGQNSVKIESGNSQKLMEAILDLYQNKVKCDKIGKNARKFTEENFDIKKIAEKYKEIYKNL